MKYEYQKGAKAAKAFERLGEGFVFRLPNAALAILRTRLWRVDAIWKSSVEISWRDAAP